jgi:hypothetical protein
VIYKEQQPAKKLREQFHGNLILLGFGERREKIKSGPGKQRMEGKQFRLAQKIKYIQRRAAEYDARFVTVGPLVFFSTQTGDAWMLDPSDQLAARLACDGDPEPIDFQETDTNRAIGWKGNYHIEGRAFVYADREAGRIITILGYPTAKLAQLC